jgi:1-deoxy-D-xylulose-5-phosphate synthase
MTILDKIKGVKELRKLPPSSLTVLASEVRERIIEVTSKNGGHIASSLGVVDLTIALHYVFNTPKDKIIWDVGHQSYAHKILTGRNDRFDTLRRFGGISGFPKMNESEFDAFNTGHSSTSLSAAHGMAAARDIKKEKFQVVAVIGDGSLTGGMAFEALNNIGHTKNDLIIILNDNEHSISKNVGALSEYLTRMISGSFYNRLRRGSMNLIRRIPWAGDSLYNFIYRIFSGFKGLLIPGQLFQDMGIRYFGPVDGHNISLLIDVLENVKGLNNGPKIVHVITKKGSGYLPAEMDPARFHGTGPFDIPTGVAEGASSGISYSEIAGKALAELAVKDKKIVAVTAAMKLGTGLYEFEKKCPRRLFDVGIAEQHMVTFSAAMAAGGLKPFISIYSTFLQRAVDQIIHDAALMKLPVKILIDRAGIVGDDGETHHGLYDIVLLKSIPGMMILAPSNADELVSMIRFAASYEKGPVAIRYPRGRVKAPSGAADQVKAFVPGRIALLTRGADAAIFAVGDMVKTALETRDILKKDGISVTVVNLLTIKPLDIKGIERAVSSTRLFVTLENGCADGGAGHSIIASISPRLRYKNIFCGGFPDEIITHGESSVLFKNYGLDPESIARRIKKALK